MSDSLRTQELAKLIRDETDETDLRDVTADEITAYAYPKKCFPKALADFDDTLFLTRFRCAADVLFTEAKKYDSETVRGRKSSISMSAWATLMQFSADTLEANTLPIIMPEAKMCFSQNQITIDFLEEKLLRVEDYHRDARGVYLNIGRGPHGEFSLYIGSSKAVFVRIMIHEKRMRNNDRSTNLYKTLTQPGWSHCWRILAMFDESTHQSYSYLLETIFILIVRSIETDCKNYLHPINSQIMVQRLYDGLNNDFMYADVYRGLNQSLPTTAGWPMGCEAPKICEVCHVSDKSQHTANMLWHFYSKDKPFDSWQCQNCYNLPYNHGKGRKRTREDQEKLEARHDTRAIRAIKMKGENPSRCDWCGRESGTIGRGTAFQPNTTFNRDHALCLCSLDHARASNDTYLRLKIPDLIQSPNGMCERCDLTTSTKFVPYPIKKFLCSACLDFSGSVIQCLEKSRFQTTKVHAKGESTYLQYVIFLQITPSCVLPSLQDAKLLAGTHVSLLTKEPTDGDILFGLKDKINIATDARKKTTRATTDAKNVTVAAVRDDVVSVGDQEDVLATSNPKPSSAVSGSRVSSRSRQIVVQPEQAGMMKSWLAGTSKT